MFCDQTVCGETAIFTTSSNLCVLCACDKLQMDETFISCRRYFAQFYTVFGYANDTYLPPVYALLSNKDQLTYEFLLSRIKYLNRSLEGGSCPVWNAILMTEKQSASFLADFSLRTKKPEACLEKEIGEGATSGIRA